MMQKLNLKKRLNKFLFVFLILIVSAFVSLFIGIKWFDENCADNIFPDKLSNIPELSFWRSTCKEGFWFNFVEFDKNINSIRIRIYNDYDGSLVYDANFRPDSSCCISLFEINNLAKQIKVYDRNNNLNNILLENDSCTLYPILPAFGGIFWELYQEYEKN